VAPNDQLDGIKSQTTYGEATPASLRRVVEALEEVGFTSDSVFIDIGSGFGKVLFDVAVSTPMLCLGYEMVDVRVQYS
jgi:tRNA G46 methylase TrmB